MAPVLSATRAGAAPGSLFGLRGRVWLMTFGHLVIDSNAALLFALLPLFVGRLHINFAQAGALATVLLTTSSVTQPAFGVVQDRHPRLPLSSAGLLVAGVAMGLTGFVATYVLMIALVVVAGLGVAAFHPQAVAQAARASARNQAWGIAIFFTGGSTGTGIMSLVIVPLAAAFGPRATLVALIPAAVTAALFWRAYSSWLQPARVKRSETAGASVRAVALPLSMLLVVSILRSAVMTAYLTFLPTLVVVRTGSLGLGAAALAVFLFAGSAGALLGGAAAHRFGSEPVVLISLVTGMLGLLPVPWLPAQVLVPWMFIAGVLMFASEAQVTSLAQRLLPAFVGVASSLMMGVGLGIGNVGAILTGAVADAKGIQFALTATTLVMTGAIAAACIFVVSVRGRRPHAFEEA
ncbi:MAG TPA: MFS transporter [Candidatus Dormibacteraeota bacterium]|nr:MFS transporter [Candidatus Dormibacteraeota bacterium]